MSRLEVLGVHKSFGDIRALDGVGLEVPDGSFFVLVGPSGAGKTTTLRVIAGLESPDEGEVRFDGVSAAGVTPAARDVAMVFQSYALYPRSSARANIASPLRARRLAADEIDRRVRAVAELLHIEHLLDRRPAQLSGGEQQRVALCRALVREPRAYLMDEPLTNLDLKLRAEMRTELTRLHRQLGRTFLYVTNDQVEAMSMADKLAVLNQGRIQQVGTPEEVYDRPANRFVASFIGSPRINLLACAYTDGVLKGEDGWRLPAPAGQSSGLSSGRLLLGVRAESLSVGASEGRPGFDGTVYAVEPLGDRVLVDVEIGSTVIKVKAAPNVGVRPGEAIRVGVDERRLHLFDAATGDAGRS